MVLQQQVLTIAGLAQSATSQQLGGIEIEELLAKAGLSILPKDLRKGGEVPLSTLEVHIRWDTPNPAKGSRGVYALQDKSRGRFAVLESKRVQETYSKPRSDELAPDRIVVAGIDGKNNLLVWAIIPDPRIIRAEYPLPRGELEGTTLHYSVADFLVPLPDDPSIARLSFYLPRWKGETCQLDLLGSTSIR
jgi:hypothetical protein